MILSSDRLSVIRISALLSLILFIIYNFHIISFLLTFFLLTYFIIKTDIVSQCRLSIVSAAIVFIKLLLSFSIYSSVLIYSHKIMILLIIAKFLF